MIRIDLVGYQPIARRHEKRLRMCRHCDLPIAIRGSLVICHNAVVLLRHKVGSLFNIHVINSVHVVITSASNVLNNSL
jgi:hypothetical protein